MGKLTNKIISKYLKNYVMQLLYITYVDKYNKEPNEEELTDYAKNILAQMQIRD